MMASLAMPGRKAAALPLLALLTTLLCNIAGARPHQPRLLRTKTAVDDSNDDTVQFENRVGMALSDVVGSAVQAMEEADGSDGVTDGQAGNTTAPLSDTKARLADAPGTTGSAEGKATEVLGDDAALAAMSAQLFHKSLDKAWDEKISSMMDAAATSKDATATSMMEATAPSDDATAPSDDATAPSDDATATSDDATATSKHATATSKAAKAASKDAAVTSTADGTVAGGEPTTTVAAEKGVATVVDGQMEGVVLGMDGTFRDAPATGMSSATLKLCEDLMITTQHIGGTSSAPGVQGGLLDVMAEPKGCRLTSTDLLNLKADLLDAWNNATRLRKVGGEDAPTRRLGPPVFHSRDTDEEGCGRSLVYSQAANGSTPRRLNGLKTFFSKLVSGKSPFSKDATTSPADADGTTTPADGPADAAKDASASPSDPPTPETYGAAEDAVEDTGVLADTPVTEAAVPGATGKAGSADVGDTVPATTPATASAAVPATVPTTGPANWLDVLEVMANQEVHGETTTSTGVASTKTLRGAETTTRAATTTMASRVTRPTTKPKTTTKATMTHPTTTKTTTTTTHNAMLDGCEVLMAHRVSVDQLAVMLNPLCAKDLNKLDVIGIFALLDSIPH